MAPGPSARFLHPARASFRHVASTVQIAPGALETYFRHENCFPPTFPDPAGLCRADGRLQPADRAPALRLHCRAGEGPGPAGHLPDADRHHSGHLPDALLCLALPREERQCHLRSHLHPLQQAGSGAVVHPHHHHPHPGLHHVRHLALARPLPSAREDRREPPGGRRCRTAGSAGGGHGLEVALHLSEGRHRPGQRDGRAGRPSHPLQDDGHLGDEHLLHSCPGRHDLRDAGHGKPAQCGHQQAG